MLRIAAVLWLVMLVSKPMHRPSIGQSPVTPVCITHSDTASKEVARLEFAITSVSDIILADVSLPPKAQATVSLVTSDSLCTLGVQAYNAALLPADSTFAVARILLLKVGTTRYVASYPYRRGQRILDTSFNVLATMF